MNDSRHHNQKRQRAQRGVSLIEVLVVLVILVTGILAIIRLFPSGFFSIESTGNSALADSLGVAAVQAGAQDSQNLPDAILPDNLVMGADDLLHLTANAAEYSNYDPDDPNTLENARVVSNETISVPSVSSGQSVYVVKYGPVVLPQDPSANVGDLPSYLTVNSPNWAAQTGDSTLPQTVGSNALPQDMLVPGREQFLVDLTNKKIAVPYAAYTPDPGGGTFPLGNGTVVPNAVSYPQAMVLVITYADGSTATEYLTVPAATKRDSTNPYAPFGSGNQAYLPDTTMSPAVYQGGWFDPTAVYGGVAVPNPQGGLPWASVALYRPYNGVLTNAPFDNDPYEFKLLAGNFGTANPGAMGFNPKAAGGVGAQARKAQISYIVDSWSILHEDYDIPTLTGAAGTFAVRTTVPNLLLAGSANPDNSINPGIAGSSDSLVILDLNSGTIVAPSGVTDPTNPDSPVNNEDLNGTNAAPNLINVSFSLGRLTFGSDAFGDNSSMTPTDGTGTAPAHRVRIFYTAALNWTVAVQKVPAYFAAQVTSPAGTATGTTGLGANQYAYDSADAFVYFARCNAGKTVEIDGSYTSSGGTTQAFSDTVSIDPILYAVGDSDVRVDLTDSSKFEHPVPQGAAVTFTAVRGLSSRAVVAWKERNQYKVHSVDAVLTRTP